jgi:hypothetical protein
MQTKWFAKAHNLVTIIITAPIPRPNWDQLHQHRMYAVYAVVAVLNIPVSVPYIYV